MSSYIIDVFQKAVTHISLHRSIHDALDVNISNSFLGGGEVKTALSQKVMTPVTHY